MDFTLDVHVRNYVLWSWTAAKKKKKQYKKQKSLYFAH